MKNMNLRFLLFIFTFFYVQADKAMETDLNNAIKASLISYKQDKFNKDLQKAKEESLRDQDKENCKLTDKSSLIRLEVLNQNGSDCFFHALKNGLYIYNWKKGIIDKKTCKEYLKSNNPKIFPLEKWRTIISKKFGIKDNLDDEAGSYIAKDILKLTPYEFTIIPNIFEVKQNSIDLNKNLENTIIEFLLTKNIRTHIFILGNMKHYKSREKIKSTFGHWISIVVHKENGKLTYYGTDSKPNSKKIFKFYEQLSNIIEKGLR